MTDETLALPAPDEPRLLPAPEQPKLLPPPGHASAADGGGSGDEAGAKRRRLPVVAVALAVIVLLLVIGWLFHHHRARQAEQANQDARDLIPTTSVIEVEASPATSDLRLPGSISPLTEASLFARASGYLSMRYVDIGDTVHKGQVMAEIDSPDLDQQVSMARQQLDQARSAVNDAKARVALAQVSYDRLASLIKDQAVSQQQVDQGRQDLDTARAGVVSSVANVGAAQANLQRLVVLQGYEKVRAPFDGVVTARNIDVGALINAAGANSASSSTMNSSSASSPSSGASSGSGSASSSATETQNASGNSSTELFRVAQAGRVRVFVTVPQENASSVVPETSANVFVQGFEEPFKGKVTRTAQSLDPSARTLLTEVQVPNPQQRLVPGMYAEVGFQSPRRGAPLLIPGEAVMARADGLRVAVIEDLSPEERAKLPKPDPDAKKRRQKEREAKQADQGGDQKGKGGDGKGGSGKGGDSGRNGGKGNAHGDEQGGRAGGDSGGSEDQDDDQDPSKARRVHLQKVEVGRDYGNEIEIVRGLRTGMTIVANPGDDVIEGAIVIAQPRPPKNDQGGGGRGAAGGQGQGEQGGGRDRSGASDAGSGGSTSPDRGPGNKDAPPQGIGSPSMEAPTKGRH